LKEFFDWKTSFTCLLDKPVLKKKVSKINRNELTEGDEKKISKKTLNSTPSKKKKKTKKKKIT